MGLVPGADHARDAQRYAERVIAGKIPACKWVRLACERHVRDLDTAKDRGLYFDPDAAGRICRHVERLPHIKGKWARAHEKIRLEPWQKFSLCNVFGWKRIEDDLRRYHTVYIEVPRKNAKSTLTAAVALYMLGPDEEEGAECVTAATTRDQASIVFSLARHMALRTPLYRERFGVEVSKYALVRDETASNLRSVSSEHDTLDGLNVHLASVDELHAHKSRALWDVLDTARGSREQPILWGITTAGGDQDGICYEQRDYVCKVLEGVLEDDAYYGIIYTVDDPDAWDDPEQWRMANPNYGVSVRPESLEDAAKKARHSAPALRNFQTKHLNIWVNAAAQWMNMEEWKSCGSPDLRLEDFAGRQVYLGLDLASRSDIASMAYIFPGEDGAMTVFGKHFLPGDLVEEKAATTGGHYLQWASQGWLTLTEGTVIDLDTIEDLVAAEAERYPVTALAYDPWQATQLAQHLIVKGIPCIEIRPTVQNFSAAMKEVEALVRSGKLRHNCDPVATWMVSNVVAKEDFKDNVFPRKERPNKKIDFFVALLSAMNRAMLTEAPKPSVYETRGLIMY